MIAHIDIDKPRTSISQTLELHVEGLCCTGCAVAVEKALKHRAGVEDINILSAAEKVQIRYDAERVRPEMLADAITALGYKTTYSQEGVTTPALETKRLPLGNAISFGFVALVAVIILAEIGAESLGLFERAQARVPLPVLLAAILIGGYPIFRRAFLGLRSRQINVDTMMSVGILGAAAIGQFTAAALIVFFMNLAHWLEAFTIGKARKAIQELIRLAPKTAHIKFDGRELEVPVERLAPGDVVAVRPGEQIPADGVVIAGASAVNQASITGESLPVEKRPGDTVFAATLNERGHLEVRVTRVGADTTFGKIVKLVEEAEAVKAPVQKFADRFMTYFLPTAIAVAGLTYFISGEATYAIAVLVAACPCAVGLATPLSVVAGVGRGARHGLLIKGGLYLERLARVDCVVMDKTGTITFGRPQVTGIVALNERPATELLALAAAVEQRSEHPLASAILSRAQAEGITASEAQDFEYAVGKGIGARVAGRAVLLGNARFLDERGVSVPTEAGNRIEAFEREGKTALLLAVDGRLEGLIAVADVIRAEIPEAVAALKRLGIKRLILLTGDNERVAAAVAAQIGVSEHRASLLPEDKIAIMRELQRAGYTVAMVGDGVNDAPALAQADVGIAMGVAGSDVALEAAHVALMRDDWREIPEAIRTGRRTYRTIRQNIALGITWDVITMGLASAGILSPVMAAATEVVPDVLVSLNSARLLKTPRRGN